MKRKTIVRVGIYTVSALIILFIGMQLFISLYMNKRIKDELQQEISKQTQGEYEFIIGKLSTNIFNQSVYISDLLLKPDRNIDPSSPKYYVSASEVNLVNFGLFSLIFRRHLKISGIEVVNPSGYIYRSTKAGIKSTKEPGKQFSVYDLISKTIHALRIDKLEIKNADIRIFDDVRDSIPSMVSNDNELKIVNLRIDQSTADASRLFMADKANLVINKFAYTTKDSLYTFHVKQLNASYTDSVLIMDSLKVIPNYSKRRFGDEAGKQTDRLTVSASLLHFYSMDVKLFFERNWFIARDLNIDKLSVAAYRNKNDTRKAEHPKSVQKLLKSIPIYAAIDSIHIKMANVAYEEVAEGAVKPGKITFSDINGTITGFTSDTILFSKNKSLQLNATGKFMDAGRVRAHYSFPLNTEEMVFDCSGSLVNMPLKEINPMLEPNANVSMTAGVLDSMVFSFHANEHHSKGKMNFLYHGLRLQILNKEHSKTGGKEGILSFLVHKLIIIENNPTPKQLARVSVISYQRNPSRFIFNYTWKSILSGIKPVIGIPENLGAGKKK